ncbi:sigma 54-interacting transcriptional regulator [candidate division KSB1 bacterium]|nr:sigma 54-interacting transcriptional regulator [candidate division KSB1 bacterium]
MFDISHLRTHRIGLGLTGILLICSLLAVLPYSFNQTVEDTLVDVQFKLRGPRELSEQFVVVFIGAEDIQALGGWPLTRDYYGYLMHILTSRGAKVIGFDLLLDAPQWRYPEYDSVLAGFFAGFDRDCLPFTFAELAPSSHLFGGNLPTRPWADFRKNLGGEGFSNFERTTMARRAPLLAAVSDSLVPSFGFELARLFLEADKDLAFHSNKLTLALPHNRLQSFPLDEHGRLRLNHFGETDHLETLSFVELLQTFSAQPDSLDFTGKLVLVAVTDPSLCTFKSTPLAASVPASFIHLTVAENLIQQNYLREPSVFWKVLILALIVAAVWLLNRHAEQKLFAGMGALALVAYWGLAAWLFRYGNLTLPVFYPTLTALSSLSLAFYQRQRERRARAVVQQQLLQEQILSKETQLEAATTAMASLQQRLQGELHERAVLSQASRQQLEEQQRKILALEKQLSDLHTYAAPPTKPGLRAFAEIVHASNSPIVHVLELVAKVSGDDIPVLIQGETGTGKELIARAIHQTGKRKAAPFVPVNCGALPETLLESELFGHEKGSFTGAVARRRGRFELAEGGTIFLDEVSETSSAFQARLLRVLQEGVFERVGGEASLQANVRVLAASNRDLQQEVAQKKFRADLFYRLNGFVIVLPSLRERAVDLPLLAQHFLRKHGAMHLTGFSEEAMAALQNYAWPGNVRELENTVRRAALLAQGAKRTLIRREDLPKEILAPQPGVAATPIYQSLSEQILQSLRTLKFSRAAISQTAKALGNRDRGTVTEYFRGMCFESFVQAEYDVSAAAKRLAETREEEVINRVRIKLEEYLDNLRSAADLQTQCKGLPKKYHAHVESIAGHFAKK